MARTSRRPARRSGVDPRDEPSAEWGWHGTFSKATPLAGAVVAILLLLMTLGPYQSHLQDFWIIGIALVILAGVVWLVMRRRNAWRK